MATIWQSNIGCRVHDSLPFGGLCRHPQNPLRPPFIVVCSALIVCLMVCGCKSSQSHAESIQNVNRRHAEREVIVDSIIVPMYRLHTDTNIVTEYRPIYIRKTIRTYQETDTIHDNLVSNSSDTKKVVFEKAGSSSSGKTGNSFVKNMLYSIFLLICGIIIWYCRKK